jgi:hypothetical protein
MIRSCLIILSLSTIAMALNVAVLDFKSADSLTGVGSILGDRVCAFLVEKDSDAVVERQQISEILKEQGFQQSGCTTSECAVEVGRLLNVQRLIVGSIQKESKALYVSMKVVDVETGRILTTAQYANKEFDRILGRIPTLVNGLMYSVKTKKAKEHIDRYPLERDSTSINLYPELSKGPPPSKVIGAVVLSVVGAAIVTFAAIDFSHPGEDNATFTLQ